MGAPLVDVTERTAGNRYRGRSHGGCHWDAVVAVSGPVLLLALLSTICDGVASGANLALFQLLVVNFVTLVT